MNIFIYTDESGVFDKIHNEYFVFGGVVYLSSEERDIAKRKYIHVEKNLRKNYQKKEMKASVLKNKDKGKIFRSLNNTIKFATLIKQDIVLDEIFTNKKSKQRFLDYIYKRLIKELLKKLKENKVIKLNDIKNIYINCDEHTTATNGRYELKEALESEFKFGTYNYNYSCFFEPLCKNIETIDVKFVDSKKNPLIRAADIVCNRVFYFAKEDRINELKEKVIILEYRKDYN